MNRNGGRYNVDSDFYSLLKNIHEEKVCFCLFVSFLMYNFFLDFQVPSSSECCCIFSGFPKNYTETFNNWSTKCTSISWISHEINDRI